MPESNSEELKNKILRRQEQSLAESARRTSQARTGS